MPESIPSALPTKDLLGVEIFASGGPFFGIGSPPEGDFYTETQIGLLAEASNAAEAEIRPPVKIGHSSKQKLLSNSGLSVDEQPAAGWVTNFRADGGKLLADLKRVPKKLADLIESGAFRTRSVELKKHGDVEVVSALSLLGAKAPAVKTLDDIVALYAAAPDGAMPAGVSTCTMNGTPGFKGGGACHMHDGTPDGMAAAMKKAAADVKSMAAAMMSEDLAADDPEMRSLDFFAEGDVAWSPDEGLAAIRESLEMALNPGGMMGDSPFCVSDVAADGSRALVTKGWGEGGEAWVVPFTVVDGEPKPSPSADWTKVEKTWVVAMSGSDVPPIDDLVDTTTVKPENQKPVELSDEMVAKFAETLDIDEADDAKRREAVVAKMAELLPKSETDDGEGEGEGEGDKPVAEPEAAKGMSDAEVEVLKAKAERGDRAFEELRTERRDAAIKSALEEGRLDPAKADTWRGFFDNDEAQAKLMLAEMPVNPEFTKVYGRDEDGSEGDDDALYAAYAEATGIPVHAGGGA